MIIPTMSIFTVIMKVHDIDIMKLRFLREKIIFNLMLIAFVIYLYINCKRNQHQVSLYMYFNMFVCHVWHCHGAIILKFQTYNILHKHVIL